MGERYAVTDRHQGGTAVDATAAVLGISQPGTAVGKRGYLYDLIWGSDDTAADNSLRAILQRHTAYAAADDPCNALDFDAPDSLIEGLTTYTSVTLTAGEVMLQIGFNQRSTQRWVASPGGEIVVPNANNNGLTFMIYHASATPNISSTIHFSE